MELDGDDPTGGKSSKDVRKNIPIKLKSGKGRGRPRKVSKASKASKKKETPPKEKKDFLEDPDLEEPREEFSTMKVTGEEPVHKAQKLKWDHKVNLLGIKVVDPIIHTCSTCYLPILIYGRMIPCKHVFCFDCAKKTDKVCSRCNDPVNRVEQSALGAVFVCNYGGSKHGVTGCRRTYLSQRDLQAHINYRHLKQEHSEQQQTKQALPPSQPQAPPPAVPIQQAPPLQVAITSPGQVQGYGGLPITSPPGQTMPMVGSQPPQQQQQSHDHSMIYHQQPQKPQQPPPLQPPPQQLPPPPQHHRPVTDNLPHGTPSLQPQPHPAVPVSQIHQSMPPPPLAGNLHTLPPHSQGPPMAQPPRMPPPGTSHVDSFHSIPVMSSRTSNLITIQIQDEADYNRREQSQYQLSGTVVSQPMPFHHPPPPPQNMMSGPPPPTQPHYNPSSVNHNTAPMMNQPPPFNTNTHIPPPQVINTSHPPPMTGPRPLNVNLSQPPPNTPLPNTSVPPPPRQGPPPPQGPPLPNRYPAPPRPPFDNKSNIYQPPPNNPRTWQGGPPPGPMGSGPPPCNPNNTNNMGPPQQRPFYQ